MVCDKAFTAFYMSKFMLANVYEAITLDTCFESDLSQQDVDISQIISINQFESVKSLLGNKMLA